MCAFDITKNKYSSINRDRCIDWSGKLNKNVCKKKVFSILYCGAFKGFS